MAKKRYYQEMGMGREVERQGYNMITEDHKAMANLPQESKIAYWPKPDAYINDRWLDDTIGGVNDQMSRDAMKARRQQRPEKV